MRVILTASGLEVEVDEDNYNYLSSFIWYVQVIGNKKYVSRSYRKGIGWHSQIQMSHEVIRCPNDKIIIHIDGNGLNNQKENLLLSSFSKSQANSPSNSNNKTGYKGVCYNEKAKKFEVQIQSKGQKIHFGYYSSKHEGAIVYNKASQYYFGDLAFQNVAPKDYINR